MEGFQSGAVQQLSGSAWRSGISHGSGNVECRAAGSLHAGISTSSSAVPSTQVSGPGVLAGLCSPWACGVQLDATGLDITNSIRGKWSYILFPQ